MCKWIKITYFIIYWVAVIVNGRCYWVFAELNSLYLFILKRVSRHGIIYEQGRIEVRGYVFTMMECSSNYVIPLCFCLHQYVIECSPLCNLGHICSISEYVDGY